MVFVFGAGASQADGLPLQSQLLARYFQESRNDDDPERSAVRKCLSEFMAVFYNVTEPCSAVFPEIDRIFGLIDLCRDGKLPSLGRYGREELDLVWLSLLAAVADVVRLTSREQPVLEHMRFGRKLNLRYPGLEGVHFVSLNYDCLLDSAFQTCGDGLEEVPIDSRIKLNYGMRLVNHTKPRFERISGFMLGTVAERPSYILKPHGGLSLAYCPACGSSELFPCGYFVGEMGTPLLYLSTALRHGGAHCLFCDSEELRPFFMPPAQYRGQHSPPYDEVMACARELLTRETEFCFIGYSLPYTDFDIWQLLKEAELKSGPKKVLVVNKLNSDQQNRDTEERYRQVFSNIRYLPLKRGFAEFIGKMTECLAWFDKKTEETAGNEDA